MLNWTPMHLYNACQHTCRTANFSAHWEIFIKSVSKQGNAKQRKGLHRFRSLDKIKGTPDNCASVLTVTVSSKLFNVSQTCTKLSQFAVHDYRCKCPIQTVNNTLLIKKSPICLFAWQMSFVILQRGLRYVFSSIKVCYQSIQYAMMSQWNTL